jgi:lipoate-protein ligase B
MLFENWGRVSYLEGWERQRLYVEDRILGRSQDKIIFCEHDPVVTLGRGSQRDPSEKEKLNGATGIPIFEIERGGLATYHGPGQIVVYPIVKLMSGGKRGPFFSGVHGLIRSLENIVAECLKKNYGLLAGPIPDKTGVWVKGTRKIASIGISAKRWVSYHGLALNISTGGEPWKAFNPCGFDPSVMTDICTETGQNQIEFEQVRSKLEVSFREFLKHV